MAHSPQLTVFSDRDALAHALADRVEAALRLALVEKERASLAVSGGSSPRVVHELLAERSLDWGRVDVLLVDERWVPPDQEGSNESFVKETLIQGKAKAANFIGFWSNAEDLYQGADAATQAVSRIDLPIDAVVLGIGPDGHTASWFPHAEGLSAALSDSAPAVAAVKAKPSDVTGALTERLTLSLPMVANAGLVALLMNGDAKRAVFEEALLDGDVEDLPVRAVLRKRPDIFVGWAP